MTSGIENQWRHPENVPVPITSDIVHVWRIGLEMPEARIQDLTGLLTTEESRRADRFLFVRDRDRFIVSHAALTSILSRYLEVDPGQVSYCQTVAGKPYLQNGLEGSHLGFSLSHSGEFALCAVSVDRAVGIDIEHSREGIDEMQIAREFFAPEEMRLLLGLPQGLRSKAFYECWTRKEAYLKASDQTISIALDQFVVSLEPEVEEALLKHSGDAREIGRWRFRELYPSPDYVASVVAEGHSWRLECWDWAFLEM